MTYKSQIVFSNEDLVHFGVPGMKWGVRRYQNSDGSLTEKGKKKLSNYQQKQSAHTSKVYDNTISSHMKKSRKYQAKADKAKNDYNETKANKYQVKANAQKNMANISKDFKSAELKSIKKMSYDRMKSEKKAVRKEVAKSVLATVAGTAIGTAGFGAAGLPVRAYYVNVAKTDAARTNSRLSKKQQNDIIKKHMQ